MCNKIPTATPTPLDRQIFGRTLEQRRRRAAPAPDRPRSGRDPRAGGVLWRRARCALCRAQRGGAARKSACMGWRSVMRIAVLSEVEGSRRAAARPTARGGRGQARSAGRRAARPGRSRPRAGGGADAQFLIFGDEVLIGQTALEATDLLADCARQRVTTNPDHPNAPVIRVR